ncbi:hypothetical protein BEN47_18525 [Hymenobacter lapidarius]|uniref:Polyhydroxyalkanoate synthesis regulator phasin n=2 Tax=Hymenobacter lapidarius TaxID=1908237 RepID=A0A1G1SV13_9BACT|nr:hypothetical protein BEN47_18525 [Hymenobacter lapidarius]
MQGNRLYFNYFPDFIFHPNLFLTMEDLFKKFVNAGVGYIAQGSKSVQSTIEKLVKDNKMTQAEGKKIVDELMKSGETKRVELEKQFQGLSERIKSTVGMGETKAKSGSRSTAAKKPAGKAAAKPATSVASKAAGATKKAADKVSSAAGTAQKSAAAKAGAAKKPAAKKPAAAASSPAASADKA